MTGLDFFYFSCRCRKHKQMAVRCSSDKGRSAHLRLADAYANLASAAMSTLL